MEFVFQISPYDKPGLVPQVSQALEKHTELRSRKALPKLWTYTDRLNSRKKAPTQSLRKRRVRSRIYGIALLLLGVLLLVPGLMEPQELFVPLLAGMFSTGAGIASLWRSRKRPSGFDKSAHKLLAHFDGTSSAQVGFTSEGMCISNEETVPYSAFGHIIESEDLFLLIWEERIIVLQKRDMILGEPGNFSAFLAGHAPAAAFSQIP